MYKQRLYPAAYPLPVHARDPVHFAHPVTTAQACLVSLRLLGCKASGGFWRMPGTAFSNALVRPPTSGVAKKRSRFSVSILQHSPRAYPTGRSTHWPMAHPPAVTGRCFIPKYIKRQARLSDVPSRPSPCLVDAKKKPPETKRLKHTKQSHDDWALLALGFQLSRSLSSSLSPIVPLTTSAFLPGFRRSSKPRVPVCCLPPRG